MTRNMLLNRPVEMTELRQAIDQAYHMDEEECVNQRISQAQLSSPQKERIYQRAYDLVSEVRQQRHHKSGIDAFMHEYGLSTSEGVALMCIAEAMLRIPDQHTIDELIRDKVAHADWSAHAGRSDSFFVNATTWGLMLSGRILSFEEGSRHYLGSAFKKLVSRASEPFIRQAVYQAMRILGRQFVMGRTIEEAVKRAGDKEQKGYSYSYDMLGEAARTEADAQRYYKAYQTAIEKIGEQANPLDITQGPGISVKLSALHPRYEFAQQEAVFEEITDRLVQLTLFAKDRGVNLTVDAEEADRLDISLDIFEKVAMHERLRGWNGLGLAVQAYQKRAYPLLDWLADLARKSDRKLMVRLVKGAYWDTEIKATQISGYQDYPVFTRKIGTDVSYIACAKKLIDNKDAFYPQFATHNAHTVATIMELMGDSRDFEFQCLHGMGDALYDQIVGEGPDNYSVRIYAPVGSHEELLPYLVRRLLENGANSSFINRIVDDETPIEDIITDPMDELKDKASKSHPQIPKPKHLYHFQNQNRKNSKGVDLTQISEINTLKQRMDQACQQKYLSQPTIGDSMKKRERLPCVDPSDNQRLVGEVIHASEQDVEKALGRAGEVRFSWDETPVDNRAACLEKMADLLEQNLPELMSLVITEAGKTLPDAVAEVREAVDFCRYYAMSARQDLTPQPLPGPTGETNTLYMHGRGVVVSISPWNFPLAIFTGQVAASLVAGNTVLAKPAEQTPLIAGEAVRLFHEAGIPEKVLQLLPGTGEEVGQKLVNDQRVQCVLFTGSTETANLINRQLAERQGPIIPLIAETGGQNAMIVDSSALPEQLVPDVINSAFRSTGQRCSALRVLFIQDDVADKVIEMLKGAMAELKVGDPALLQTDVGPTIDHEAKNNLLKHVEEMDKQGKLIYKVAEPQDAEKGSYFTPRAYEIDDLGILQREVFGPFLHVIRFSSKDLDRVIDAVNATGYGLTCGVHSRINETAHYIVKRLRVGNAYINRDIVGSVVGVQPFGGEGLSGTGPKAGGPHYLARLCKERTVTENTAAAGGNASLMALDES